MTYNYYSRVVVGFGVLALLACGQADSQRSAESAVATSSAVPVATLDDANVAAPESGDRFEVKIAEGPFAGTHQASGDFGCFAHQGMWGAGYTIDLERTRGLTEFSVMLTGVPAAGGRTEDVNFGLTFGRTNDESLDAGTAGIGAAVGGGSGVATVEREGKKAVIKIEGMNFSGGNVSAVVECSTVEFVG